MARLVRTQVEMEGRYEEAVDILRRHGAYDARSPAVGFPPESMAGAVEPQDHTDQHIK